MIIKIYVKVVIFSDIRKYMSLFLLLSNDI